MKMTVMELINYLEDFPEDAEVRIANQPSYPLESSIGEVILMEEQGEPVVFIAEGSQLGYLSGAASEELGWR